MSDDAVLSERRGHVLVITINRPEARNAVNPEVHRAMIAAWADFAEDDSVDVAILTGAGDDAFCAGADLKEYIPSIMAGGSQAAWERVEDIFNAIAAKFQNEPCCALVGPEGAGHFVKTIHNGIEYADMQMIAEIYGILRDGLGLAA